MKDKNNRKVYILKSFNCILNEAYPKIEVTKHSKELSDKLSVLAFGKDGELTAVLQYTYQHVSLPPKFAYAADILECISVTEMKHFEILSKLINILGGDCRIAVCDRSRYVYWNGACVDYSQNFLKMLRDDIRGEKKAIAMYNNFIDRCDDHKINALIKRIIKDEEHHLGLLYSLYEDASER